MPFGKRSRAKVAESVENCLGFALNHIEEALAIDDQPEEQWHEINSIFEQLDELWCAIGKNYQPPQPSKPKRKQKPKRVA